MESIINFLESDKNDWSLNLNKYLSNYPLLEVASKFNYTVKSKNLIRSEVENYLRDEIVKSLSDNNTTITQAEFYKIRDHFALKYYSSNKLDYKSSFYFINCINQVININNIKLYNNTIEAWSYAKECLEAFSPCVSIVVTPSEIRNWRQLSNYETLLT